MQRGLTLSMIGRGLSWSDIDTWLHHAPADAAVRSWGRAQAAPQAPPRRVSESPRSNRRPPPKTVKKKRPQLTATQVRELVASRTN